MLNLAHIDNVYEAYKKYKKGSNKSVNDLVKDLYNYSTYFCDMYFGKNTKHSTDNLNKALESFRQLKFDVAYPFLLELYGDYSKGILKENEFCEIVNFIESYIFRRSICEIPTNSLNKTFSTFSKDLNKQNYLNGIKCKLVDLNDYKRFPNDNEFQIKIKQRNVYNFDYSKYLLISLENHKRTKGKFDFNKEEYTIEHIMPQTLSEEWKSELGDKWENIHTELLHTLGNITLTEYNVEYSNELFEKN